MSYNFKNFAKHRDNSYQSLLLYSNLNITKYFTKYATDLPSRLRKLKNHGVAELPVLLVYTYIHLRFHSKFLIGSLLLLICVIYVN